ncbi:SufB/SufD family protein [Thermanaerothrix daxensis]|nr:SufD family Fe-S cluster assembly protein [Thermanaerothrix daxensis]
MTRASRFPSPSSEAAPTWAGELNAMMEAYRQAGGDPGVLQLPQVATLVISANQVLVAHEIPGVHFEAESLPHGVRAHIWVEPHTRFTQPVHLCFGLLPAEGEQEIIADYEIGEQAQVRFLAHCSFPNAIKVEHRMQARIRVGRNASLTYTEEHFHGPQGGTVVLPKAEVVVEEGGYFTTTFALTRGRVGVLRLDYHVRVEAGGVTELVTKAYGKGEDAIHVREVVVLEGPGARGLTRTRIAVQDHAQSRVDTVTEGNAPNTRGHMDCTEIVRGQAQASNNPLVIVRHDQAQVTHEAAIGTVNRKELETLMARGLSEDEAVDLIIRGLMR